MKAAALAIFAGLVLGLAWLLRVPVSDRTDLAGRVWTYPRGYPTSCAASDGGAALCVATGTMVKFSDLPTGAFR